MSAPVFIVGCGRSGTTMLRLMLDKHPEIAIPNESHFIPTFWSLLKKYENAGTLDPVRLTDDILKTRYFHLWKVPAEIAWEKVRALSSPDYADVIDAVFMSYATFHGKSRWGDKTPKYVKFIGLLADLFPQARFVHLIRDGRNVALSYLTVPWGPSNITQAAWKWKREVSIGRSTGKILGPARYKEMRYEHLVSHTAEALKEICDFIELPFVEQVLEYHKDGEERLQWPKGMRFHASSTRPPAKGLRDWTTQMSKEDLQTFEAIAGDLLNDLGYERSLHSLPVFKSILAKIKSSSFEVFTAAKKMKRKVTRRFAKKRR